MLHLNPVLPDKQKVRSINIHFYNRLTCVYAAPKESWVQVTTVSNTNPGLFILSPPHVIDRLRSNSISCKSEISDKKDDYSPLEFHYLQAFFSNAALTSLPWVIDREQTPIRCGQFGG